MLRATAPTRWAIPSQVARIPRPTAFRALAIAPGPVRRREVERDAGRRAPDARDRELEDFAVGVGDFELRDRDEEDVRVAMVDRLGADHTGLTRHTPNTTHQSARP